MPFTPEEFVEPDPNVKSFMKDIYAYSTRDNAYIIIRKIKASEELITL